MKIPDDLLPGDHLIYGPTPVKKNVVDWLIDEAICIKTWSRDACHIEIYTGHEISIASRNGKGVNQYAFRASELTHVLRPYCMVNLAPAMEWFNLTARGQTYDWKGLLCFTLAVKQGSRDKMFCSEFATRWDRYAGIRSFAVNFDADLIAPGSFLMSPEFNDLDITT